MGEKIICIMPFGSKEKMKRSIFIPLIGLVMTTAIVGSGFSVFYFYDHEVATNANGNVDVTDKIDGKGFIKKQLTYIDEAGSDAQIELTDSTLFEICLDQGEKDPLEIHTNSVEENGIPPYNTRGIYFETNGGYRVKYLHLDYYISVIAYNELNKSNIGSSYTTVIDIASPLSKYIEIKDSNNAGSNSPATKETKYFSHIGENQLIIAGNIIGANALPHNEEIDVSGVSYYKFPMTINLDIDSNYVGNIFQYKKDKKPTNQTDFGIMRDELYSTTDKLLKFETTVQFVS